YLVLIPAVVAAVIVVNISTPSSIEYKQAYVQLPMSHEPSEEADKSPTAVVNSLDEDEETTHIIAKFDALMRE
ncbi:AraC family transcriptional regulator, partial [Vibrio splendidus]